MTAWLILLALVVAVGLGTWIVFRSRREPGGSSGVDPREASRSGAEIPWEDEDGPGGEGGRPPGATGTRTS